MNTCGQYKISINDNGQTVSRVLYLTIIHLVLQLLTASSDLPAGGYGPHPLMPFSVLLRMGFTRLLCLHSTGELLPHHFNLTTALPVSAECFCCTFPTVTCGGRYPSSLPCGARTFLMHKHAIAWSAQNTAILYSCTFRIQEQKILKITAQLF